LTLLANLDKTKDVKMLSDFMNVDPEVISEKFEKLRRGGYVTKNNLLSEQGFEYLRRARQDGRLKSRDTGQEPSPVGDEENAQLSSLDYALLSGLSEGKDDRGISRITGVDDKEVERRLDALYQMGYISGKNKLSAKGFEALTAAPPGSKMAGPSEPSISPRRRWAREFERPVRVASAAILLLLYGITGTIAGVYIMVLALVLGGTSSFFLSAFGSGLALASIGSLVIGGGVLIMGVLGMVSCWGLWRVQRWGAYLGGGLLGFGFMVALAMLLYLFVSGQTAPLIFYEVAGVVLVGNGVLLVLVDSGFSRLSN
jgi:hypothetical protein